MVDGNDTATRPGTPSPMQYALGGQRHECSRWCAQGADTSAVDGVNQVSLVLTETSVSCANWIKCLLC